MTQKQYEIQINMLMAQGRKLYAIKLMKEASGFVLGLKECKEHLDEVFTLFKEHLILFNMQDYPSIYDKAFNNKMKRLSLRVDRLHFFDTNGKLCVQLT